MQDPPSKRSTWTQERRDRERIARNERRAAKVRERKPWLPPYEPLTLKGPMGNPPTPNLAKGLELRGQSNKRNARGEVTGGWDLGRKAPGVPHALPEGFALPKRISRFTAGDGGLIGQWQTYDAERIAQTEALLEAFEKHAEEYAGFIEPAPVPPRGSADTLVLLPIGDYHLGLLAWAPETGGDSWDLKHAKVALPMVVGELVRMAPEADRCIIANLGDFKHAQDDTQLTPGHKHKLDVDGRNAKVEDAALLLLTTTIDLALRKFRHVTMRNIRGNHDEIVAPALARELKSWYRNEPRVEVAPAYADHQYDVFGASILGYHHGHKTPAAELPGVMAHDKRDVWSSTRFGYWHCGHIHHRSKFALKEYPNVIVETHGIIAPADAYTAGRYRSTRGMQFIAYDRDFGESGRGMVGIERVRAAIRQAVESAA